MYYRRQKILAVGSVINEAFRKSNSSSLGSFPGSSSELMPAVTR